MSEQMSKWPSILCVNFTHRAMIWSTSSKTDLVHVNYLLFICQNLNISFPAMFIQNETTHVWYHGIEVTCFVLHRSLESEVTSKPVWWHFLLSLLLFFILSFVFLSFFLSLSHSFFFFLSLLMIVLNVLEERWKRVDFGEFIIRKKEREKERKRERKKERRKERKGNRKRERNRQRKKEWKKERKKERKRIKKEEKRINDKQI